MSFLNKKLFCRLRSHAHGRVHVRIGEGALPASGSEVGEAGEIVLHDLEWLLEAEGKDGVGVTGMNEMVGDDLFGFAEALCL